MQDRTARAEGTTEQAPQQAEAADQAAPAQPRHVAGAVPAVGAGEAPAQATASQLAYEEDKNVVELKAKVGGMVSKKFGGDFKKAFESYDSDKDGAIDKDELVGLLRDSGVGNGITRGAWASGVIEKLDKSGDGKIQWTEFASVATERA